MTPAPRFDPSGAQRALADAVASVEEGVPGVVAGVTDAAGTRWLGTAGVRSLATGEPMADDTVLALHSATKAVTATAALQCAEDGTLDLDAPAADLVPEIADLEVLVGVDGDTVRTRPPVRAITARMLLLHTSGLGYPMFDARLADAERARRAADAASGLAPSTTPLRDSLFAPLLHDPGTQFTYGTSLDWLGLVVAAARGQRLEDVFRERIFAPCGMASTSFDMPAAMRERLATVHIRRDDGSARPARFTPPDRPELDMGGQGLYSTVPDYLAFLRVWLGDGSAPGGRVLKEETVRQAVQAIPGLVVQIGAPGSQTGEIDYLPGVRTEWAYPFLVNHDDVPGGRRAGSLSWAGVANVHFWVDRASGIAAVWGAQVVPFFDPAAIARFREFERAVYAGLG